MANREACELYIEQEIKESLAAGKKPWTIGKELSKWVEKLFEVTINPETIRTRARRIEGKERSNDREKSQPIETIEYSKPEIIENRKPQGGGTREGSGRKKLPKSSCNHIVSRDFKSAFENFFNVIKKEKENGWSFTRKEAVEDHIKVLISILTD